MHFLIAHSQLHSMDHFHYTYTLSVSCKGALAMQIQNAKASFMISTSYFRIAHRSTTGFPSNSHT